MSLQIPVDKAPISKISISFTWDDNALRHSTVIAPLFIANGFRCTFYINPGERDFDIYLDSYFKLAKTGFEIGSHSYKHQYMAALSQQEAESEISSAAHEILTTIGSYPATFAFPNHDCNEVLINQVRKRHLEIRNTLNNAVRFSIKTDTPLRKLIHAVEEAILNNTNLVFSGHSIITDNERMGNENGEGYQPMITSVLSGLLEYLNTVRNKVDIVPFSHAAIREWIKKFAVLVDQVWLIEKERLQELEKFGITQEYLSAL